MAKQILKVQMVCTQAAKNARGAAVQFAKNPEPNPQGQQTAREVVAVNVLDTSIVNDLQVVDAKGKGKTYTITITED